MLTLEEIEVVFWIWSERCSRSTSYFDLVSQNRAMEYNFTQWHMHRIRQFEFSKLFRLQLNHGWMWIPVSAHRNMLSASPPFHGLSASPNSEPRSTCLHREEIRRGQKFIKEKENPSFSPAPTVGQWMKMEITTGQCCWPQSLCHIPSSFHLHIFAPLLSVFTPNQ